MLLLAAPQWSRAATAQSRVAVIYPDIGEPYRSVFAKIIEGADSLSAQRLVSIAVAAGAAPQDLAGQLRRLDVQAVIALGRDGLRAAEGLDRSFHVVAGGVLSLPQAEAPEFAVFTLSPDPALLFARLKSLMPDARRITVVADPRHNAWLIRLAREAARSQGLELVALEAKTLKEAISLYQDFAHDADPQRHALWLAQDATTVEDSTVVPLVMQQAWNRGFAVLSSSLGHVRRGALLALYPDLFGLGRNLARAAQAGAGAPAAPRLRALTDVLTAVNIRTARHLGLEPAVGRIKVDLVFPDT